MRIAVLVGLVGVGCGTVSDKPTDASVAKDTSAIDASAIDAAPPRCNSSASFGTPVELTAIDTVSDDEGAFLSADELTIYFGSNRPGGAGGYDLYKATRASATAAFGGVTPVAGVNTAADEREPRVSSDGLTLIATDHPGNTWRLVLAQRPTVTAAFPALQPIANVSGTTNDTEPSLLPDGNVIYFGSDRGGAGVGYDIYRTARSGGGGFGTPTLVSGTQLNTSFVESSPIVTPDELNVYFLSDRTGTMGTYDIYYASRTSIANAFSTPVPVAELNTAGLEFPNWISADNCVLYFSRTTNARGYEMYAATRGN